MVELWYALVAIVFAIYVVLDGFDFGAGIVAPFVAKGDAERRMVLGAIGPYWDGNEVWLLAGGGSLFVAFPGALAAGISGFYFAIFLVLWCLIGRGISIEFRSHLADPMWRSIWDAAFVGTSFLLALFFGVAFGNLVRGLPLGADGWFALTLFTVVPADRPGRESSTSSRCLRVSSRSSRSPPTAPRSSPGRRTARSRCAAARRTAARSSSLRSSGRWSRGRPRGSTGILFTAIALRPLAAALTLLAVGSLVYGFIARARGNDRMAFVASSAFLVGILGATAAALFPVLLPARGAAELSITAYEAANDARGLRVALGWFAFGLPLALVYLGIVGWLHRGRATAAADGEGY
jgi:cytochrome d ubiquinol oxidase subunit II